MGARIALYLAIGAALAYVVACATPAPEVYRDAAGECRYGATGDLAPGTACEEPS
jgi:hypothetical protein